MSILSLFFFSQCLAGCDVSISNDTDCNVYCHQVSSDSYYIHLVYTYLSYISPDCPNIHLVYTYLSYVSLDCPDIHLVYTYLSYISLDCPNSFASNIRLKLKHCLYDQYML